MPRHQYEVICISYHLDPLLGIIAANLIYYLVQQVQDCGLTPGFRNVVSNLRLATAAKVKESFAEATDPGRRPSLNFAHRGGWVTYARSFGHQRVAREEKILIGFQNLGDK